VLTSAVSAGGKTTITGTLNSAADTKYLIQFFANVAADPSGFGQGQTFIGSITVTTDSNGNASFTATLAASVPAGQFLSATATDPDGNTSEFAQDVTISAGGSVASRAVPFVSSPSIGLLSGASTFARASAAGKANPESDAALEALAWDVVLIRQRRHTALDGNEGRSLWT
jgi:hypothetical protein